IDPPGYVSTTANSFVVAATTGSTSAVQFGDQPGAGVGMISGKVYEDANHNMVLDAGERGIRNVIVTLHTGQRDTTDAQGAYDFAVPVATYTVSEADSANYMSTTPNVVDVVLSVNGQHVYQNFGDVLSGPHGTLRGIVYRDANYNGTYDNGEAGIANV